MKKGEERPGEETESRGVDRARGWVAAAVGAKRRWQQHEAELARTGGKAKTVERGARAPRQAQQAGQELEIRRRVKFCVWAGRDEGRAVAREFEVGELRLTDDAMVLSTTVSLTSGKPTAGVCRFPGDRRGLGGAVHALSGTAIGVMRLAASAVVVNKDTWQLGCGSSEGTPLATEYQSSSLPSTSNTVTQLPCPNQL
jgi:hypothetical protein